MLEVQLLCNHLRPSKIMKFKLIAMLLLLEIIGEYSKMKVRAHLEDHYPFNICLFFLIVSFHINLILNVKVVYIKQGETHSTFK